MRSINNIMIRKNLKDELSIKFNKVKNVYIYLIHIVQFFICEGFLSRRCALKVIHIDPHLNHSFSSTSDLGDSDEPPLVYEGNKPII